MNSTYDIWIQALISPDKVKAHDISVSPAARYYNSDLSIWLSVDPIIVHKTAYRRKVEFLRLLA